MSSSKSGASAGSVRGAVGAGDVAEFSEKECSLPVLLSDSVASSRGPPDSAAPAALLPSVCPAGGSGADGCGYYDWSGVTVLCNIQLIYQCAQIRHDLKIIAVWVGIDIAPT